MQKLSAPTKLDTKRLPLADHPTRRLLLLNALWAGFGILGTFAYHRLGLAPPFEFETMQKIGALINISLGALISWRLIQQTAGAPIAWALLVAAVLIGGGAEWVGVLTGFPFGHYEYTHKMGFRVGGIVPMAIPLAWFTLLYPCYALARRHFTRQIILGVGLLMLFWDVLMEPVMTYALDYWRWQGTSVYYNVPLSNWLGWFALGSLLGAITHFFLKRLPLPNAYEARQLFLLQAGFTALMGAIYNVWAPLVLFALALLIDLARFRPQPQARAEKGML